jgi:uncharacterized PurR-regulated membrane protein YhhQ (DUF165 family)
MRDIWDRAVHGSPWVRASFVGAALLYVLLAIVLDTGVWGVLLRGGVILFGAASLARKLTEEPPGGSLVVKVILWGMAAFIAGFTVLALVAVLINTMADG